MKVRKSSPGLEGMNNLAVVLTMGPRLTIYIAIVYPASEDMGAGRCDEDDDQLGVS